MDYHCVRRYPRGKEHPVQRVHAMAGSISCILRRVRSRLPVGRHSAAVSICWRFSRATSADQDGIGNACDPFWLCGHDLDGLFDFEEDLNSNGIVDAGETDPQNPDTDGDGFGDWQEVDGLGGVACAEVPSVPTVPAVALGFLIALVCAAGTATVRGTASASGRPG